MKVKKFLAAFLAAVMMVSAFAIPASAETAQPNGNNIDVGYGGYAGYLYSTQYYRTGQREKQDDTSTYIYNQCSYTLRVRAEGFVPKNSTTTEKEWKNETCNGNLRGGVGIVPTGEYLLHTWIFEDNNYKTTLERLRINLDYNYGTTKYVYGKWSADSVGSYPEAN